MHSHEQKRQQIRDVKNKQPQKFNYAVTSNKPPRIKKSFLNKPTHQINARAIIEKIFAISFRKVPHSKCGFAYINLLRWFKRKIHGFILIRLFNE